MTRMPIVILALAAIGSGGAAIATGSPPAARAAATNPTNDAVPIKRPVPRAT